MKDREKKQLIKLGIMLSVAAAIILGLVYWESQTEKGYGYVSTVKGEQSD